MFVYFLILNALCFKSWFISIVWTTHCVTPESISVAIDFAKGHLFPTYFLLKCSALQFKNYC